MHRSGGGGGPIVDFHKVVRALVDVTPTPKFADVSGGINGEAEEVVTAQLEELQGKPGAGIRGVIDLQAPALATGQPEGTLSTRCPRWDLNVRST